MPRGGPGPGAQLLQLVTIVRLMPGKPERQKIGEHRALHLGRLAGEDRPDAFDQRRGEPRSGDHSVECTDDFRL